MRVAVVSDFVGRVLDLVVPSSRLILTGTPSAKLGSIITGIFIAFLPPLLVHLSSVDSLLSRPAGFGAPRRPLVVRLVRPVAL